MPQIGKVVPGSPAAAAGLQPGDTIVVGQQSASQIFHRFAGCCQYQN